MARLPFLTLHSDVRDVVYVSWLVDAAAAQQLVPAGVTLWQRDGKTPFTVLTYRHGHFGPALPGPLRKLLPSPLQSNWRLYLDHTPPGAPAVPCVYFLKNIMDSLPHALGTRLFSDILPTHLAAGMTLEVGATQAHCGIASGTGSAPALNVRADITAEHDLDADWQHCSATGTLPSPSSLARMRPSRTCRATASWSSAKSNCPLMWIKCKH